MMDEEIRMGVFCKLLFWEKKNEEGISEEKRARG